jgi:hypothetical protein
MHDEIFARTCISQTNSQTRQFVVCGKSGEKIICYFSAAA